MLPRTRESGIAHRDRFAGRERADGVGHDAVLGPVAAADDVARAGRGERDVGAVREKRIAIRGHDDFRRRFARAVGIVAAERIALLEIARRRATVILVALVACDHDDGAWEIHCADGFEQIGGAEHVGGEGRHRFAIGNADERLRGEVKNEFGLPFADGVFELMRVPDVLDGVLHPAFQFEREEERRLQRGQREAVDVCAEAEQPFAKPCALEAGVAGDQHALAGVDVEVGNHGESEERLLHRKAALSPYI